VQACRRGAVSSEDTVLILGAGPIGLALVEVARARGARTYVTDLSSQRLATAARLGAAPLPADDRLLETVKEITRGDGMPVVIEATGNRRAMESTIALVAPGGRIVIVGLLASGVDITLPGLDLTRKEVTILGSRASTGCFGESLQLIASGAIRYPEIGTTFDLSQAPDVLTLLAESPDTLHKGVFVTSAD
jgi:L-gulonate 5-dehydrogenase